jgi:hypothetical protein
VTDFVEHFAAVAEGAGEFLAYFGPVSVAALVLTISALSIRSPFRDPRFRKLLPLLATMYAIPALIVLAGTVLRYNGPPHPRWEEPPAWRAYSLWVIVALQVVVVLVALVRARSVRLRAAGVLLPSIWLSFCSVYPAMFSVVGVSP